MSENQKKESKLAEFMTDFGNLVAKYENDIPANILYAVIDEAVLTEKVANIVSAVMRDAMGAKEQKANG